MTTDYRKLILEDDVYLAAQRFHDVRRVHPVSNWTDEQKITRHYRHAAVVSDGSALPQLAIAALGQVVGKELDSLSAVETNKSAPIYHTASSKNVQPLALSGKKLNDTCIFMFADTRRTEKSAEWLDCARQVFTEAASSRNCRCVVCAVIPELKALPDGILSISEREYDYLLENKPDKSEAENFLLNLQALCRKAVRDSGADISLLRVANIFGPGVNGVDGVDLHGVIRECLESNVVRIDDSDCTSVRSFTYTVDAVASAFWLLWHGMGGHECQHVSHNCSVAQIKHNLHDAFPERLSMKCECGPVTSVTHACLNGLKFSRTQYRSHIRFPEWIVRTACFVANCKYPDTTNKAIYSGKLDKIKALEMHMLRAVDEICERHGLKYFIAAGSLLGAKRYGHNIPWDDDLDIAFLRRDFIKFRKIVEKELPPDLIYCCYYNGTKSHYPVDKIRVRNTYFSTSFSSMNVIEDGVFLDILVYDATSDIPPVAWVHNKVLGFLSNFLLQILWRNAARSYYQSWYTYAVSRMVRILPIRFYHWLYEQILTMFRFKRHPKFLLDGTGARVGLKKIPAAGLFDVKRIPFDDGFSAPSPADEEDYLVFAYGKNYLKEPPLSEQHGHALARIDLGGYLFSDSPRKFRPVDIRGELYEKD